MLLFISLQLVIWNSISNKCLDLPLEDHMADVSSLCRLLTVLYARPTTSSLIFWRSCKAGTVLQNSLNLVNAIFYSKISWSYFLNSLFQKGYRSLHTAARKDFAKAAKLLLVKDHKPDVEAPVRLFLKLLLVKKKTTLIIEYSLLHLLFFFLEWFYSTSHCCKVWKS